MTIKMDYREKDSGIDRILAQRYGIAVIHESLSAGDYIINSEIAVERKTAADFVRSLIDGRLFRQTSHLRRSFDSALMVIEGRNSDAPLPRVHPHAVKGGLLSIALDWRLPVLFSKNPEDTALLLYLLTKQKIAAVHDLSCRPGKRPKQLRKKQLYILQGLPQVGPVLAARLLDYFGTIENAIAASPEQLTQVPGLGKTKAGKIRAVVSENHADRPDDREPGHHLSTPNTGTVLGNLSPVKRLEENRP